MTNGRHEKFLEALKRVFHVVTSPDFFDDFVDPESGIPGRTAEESETHTKEYPQADESPA